VARLLTAGAETNDLTLEGVTQNAGTVTTQTVNPRSGSRSFKIASASSMAVGSLFPTLVSARNYYVRGYFLVDALPSAQMPLHYMNASSVSYNVMFGVNGELIFRFGTTTLFTSANGVIAINTYYRLEMRHMYNTTASAADFGELVLDGNVLATDNTDRFSSLPGGGPSWGTSTATGTNLYVDDYAVNDDQGASQNSYPGAGNVLLLLPTTDSAVGTGWTLGTGTAISSNGFGSVDNQPPTGVADLAVGSDPKQIRNATSNANVNYDATMTTYTAAGVPAGATINVVDPVTATAAPVATSAKQGTVGVVSNPAISNIALGAGGTSGAFWSGVTAGTYPTGWKISHGTTTYGPSVTLGTAPVMRITQVTSSTRIAMVCFMGMYVDYTPASTQVPYAQTYAPFLAQ
jgi:hypothetical protein